MAGRILVLDDEENYARMVHDLLRQERFQVEMATRPEDALELLRAKEYDLVVSDYKMPMMDGSQFLDEARKIRSDLPVIMVSGLMNTPELIKVANIGVTLVLEKPFDSEVFLRHVRRFVEPLPEGTVIAEDGSLESEQGRPAAKASAKTYPKHPRYVVDASDAAQEALQRVWDAVRAGAHAFVEVPPGGEFELLLREVSAWKGFDRKRVLVFDVQQLRSAPVQETLGLLADDPTASQVVGISGIEEAPADALAYLVQFIRQTTQVAPRAKGLVFLHRFVRAAALKEASGGPLADLEQLTAGRMATLPPLAARLPDVGAYAQRFLQLFADAEKRPGKEKPTPEAARLLLAHPWPGNVAQLVDVVRRAVQLGTDAGTTEADLRAAFSRHEGDLPASAASLDLASLLLGRQRAYLARIAEEGKLELGVALSMTGVSPDLQGGDPEAAAGRLLYPELLRAT